MTVEIFDLWRAPIGSDGPLTTPGKILFAGEGACKRQAGYMSGDHRHCACCMCAVWANLTCWGPL